MGSRQKVEQTFFLVWTQNARDDQCGDTAYLDMINYHTHYYTHLSYLTINLEQFCLITDHALPKSDGLKAVSVSHVQTEHNLGLVATNPVFGVSDKARLKLVSSATETS